MSKVQKQKNRDLATYYRDRGFSYSEIAGLCGVAKSTVSNWLRDNPQSRSVTERNTKRAQHENGKRLRLINAVRKRERQQQNDTVQAQAQALYATVATEPLFVAGVMMSRAAHCNAGVVRYSSTDPAEHTVWHRFLQRYAAVVPDKRHFQLVVYQNHTPVSCEKWWKRQLPIPSEQWYRTQVLAQGDIAKPPLHFGVGSTIIASASLVEKLTVWQKALMQSLV